MHYGPELVAVFVACLTLAAGALMRAVCSRVGVPYTVAMLLLGLATGLVATALLGDGTAEAGVHPDQSGHPLLARLAAVSRGISPSLIVFVFLPALVFDAAFSLKVHAFRQNVGAVTILAVPALVVATAATGALMVALTAPFEDWAWSWPAALVFGALISATDPVAVVAILEDFGAPRRLAVLIEGESLLNDGTAIVTFNVLLAVLLGTVTLSAGGIAGTFVAVVAGGIGVGIALSMIVSFWILRTFNDPLVEITLTIVLAYAAMIIAEGLLHVSGVMAIVTAGLWMSAVGKTRISPEVQHFLHQFWETLSYIANTAIFFLVGLVISATMEQVRLADVLIVLGAFVGITAIRFATTFAFLPLMNRVSAPVSAAEAAVMSWGGLRGAVSLALALVVLGHSELDHRLAEQIMGIAAGVVLLTILVNGTTTGRVLALFGFDRPPLTDQVAQATVRATVLDDVRRRIDEVARSRDLRTVSWKEVEKDLRSRRSALQGTLETARGALATADQTERSAGYWRQALEVERKAYWSTFAKGTLGGRAASIVDNEIDVQLDRLAAGDPTAPEGRAPRPRKLAAFFAGMKKRAGVANLEFERLSLLYDLWRAETIGAQAVLDDLERLAEEVDAAELDPIRKTYRRYLRDGKERLEDLRSNLPEIAQAIETRLARRIQLNFEREGYEQQALRGAMDEATARAAVAEVQRNMKRLQLGATKVALPETADLCRNSPLFAGLDEAAISELAELTIEQVLAPGEVLFRQHDDGDAMYVIARGAVHVIMAIDGEEQVVDVLGGGDIIGEMALLTGAPRTATVRAATTVTVGKVTAESFEHLMKTQPQLRDRIWASFARHRFDNYLRALPQFDHLDADDRRRWVKGQPIETIAADATLARDGWDYAFLFAGHLVGDRGADYRAPALVTLRDGVTLTARGGEARVIRLPAFETVAAAGAAASSAEARP